MKPLLKVKDLVVTLLSLAVLSSIVVSCSPGSVTENPYGTQVAAKSLCSDGVKTTLILETDLDPEFWQLSEKDFYPKGKSYVETTIIFLENDELYSSVSSGKRDDPVFDSQSDHVRTIQTFFFPRTPLPDSEFTVRAWVFLRDLPPAYTLPAGVSFAEPGAIGIPTEYVLSPVLGECP